LYITKNDVIHRGNTRGGKMIEQLTGLGYGIVTFAIVIGVGIIVLYKFGTSLGAGPANDSVTYLGNQLGSGTGGLATWTPAIIAAVVGFLFLAMFMGGTKRRK
jgi:hypothetical protein